ncbi:MAG: FecR domain-containing protein [Verrucomicrobiaceae bacterium]|nr:FecR domain-containing protein [Verrucomicrobiaceae bacterium]
MNDTERQLIDLMLDGALPEVECANLMAQIEGDAEAVAYLADRALLHSDLRHSLKRREVRQWATAAASPQTKRVVSPASRWFAWRPPMAAAAVLALLAAGWFWVGSREVRVLALVDASGTISWSEDGKWRTDLAIGEQLKAGTIETVGEATSASLRFRDGTMLNLSGDSELSFSENGQKLLVLRKGSLSAQVKPQPKDKPMLVRTASAEARVVGTVFNLAARSEDTLLKVDEGLVNLKRLADGSTIDVPAKSSAVASLDSGLKLNSTTTPEPLADWRFDFTHTMAPRDWRGFSDGACMMARPYVASRKASGEVVTHFGISVRTAQLVPPLSLMVRDKSVIRYRLKQTQNKSLQIMLLTSKTSGGYGGNFEARVDGSELKPDADGWCDVAVPVSAFKPLSPKHLSPVGNIITSALISSLQTDTKLTVVRFELKSEPGL